MGGVYIIISDKINKEERLLEWAEKNPYLTDQIKLNWLSHRNGCCAVIPVSGETALESYVDGTALKRYDFMFQVIFDLSENSDGVNADNMFTVRQWQEWIDSMEFEKNYPDFGSSCGNYELQNLSNMPQIAQVYDNLTAKYQFPARLIYTEN